MLWYGQFMLQVNLKLRAFSLARDTNQYLYPHTHPKEAEETLTRKYRILFLMQLWFRENVPSHLSFALQPTLIRGSVAAVIRHIAISLLRTAPPSTAGYADQTTVPGFWLLRSGRKQTPAAGSLVNILVGLGCFQCRSSHFASISHILAVSVRPPSTAVLIPIGEISKYLALPPESETRRTGASVVNSASNHHMIHPPL
jgi:hypothetical protein